MAKLSDDLTMIATKLMLAASRGEVVKLTGTLTDCIGKLMESERDISRLNEKTITRVFEFSEKDISKMPFTFKKEFRKNGCTAHIIKRQSGRNSYIYEIRYRRNGYNISASSKDIDEAKRKFLEALKTAEPVQKEAPALSVPKTFAAFSRYYFETFRRRRVKHATMRADLSRYNNYIEPFFRDKELKDITPGECQALLAKVEMQGKGKTSDEVHSILNQIFKAAIAHGIMPRNPLSIVMHIRHEKEHGQRLSAEEEAAMLSASAGTPFQPVLAVSLYTGVRPNELSSVRVEGDFIVAVNSKRKNHKVEYKKIPVIPALRRYLQGLTALPPFSLPQLRCFLRKILPNHKLYDLRTTFYSRCKEFGVADAARDEFVGHSLGALGNAYTDLSDAYLLKEAEKLSTWGIEGKNVPQNVPQNRK